MDKQIDLLQGTLDMLILKAVSLGPLHGYGVLLRIQQISGEQLQIQQGSLYPALYHRLERTRAGSPVNGVNLTTIVRRSSIAWTAAGKRQFQSETEKWTHMASVIAGILRTRPEEI